MLGGLLRMLSVLEPERDWGPLARVYNHLRQTAAPSRDKLSHLVPAVDLFELGLWLMDTCEEADRPQSVPYSPYPSAFAPPFHYPNPVSGRADHYGDPSWRDSGAQ